MNDNWLNGSVTAEKQARDAPILFAGTAVQVLVSTDDTGGAFCLLQVTNPVGCITPPHRHSREDEVVLVLSGVLRAETETGAIEFQPGQTGVLSRGRVHRLGNAGPAPARYLLLCTPGGFDRFVQASGRPLPALEEDWTVSDTDVGRLVAAAALHEIELLGPDVLPANPSFQSLSATVPKRLDVPGMVVEILAETEDGQEEGFYLLRGTIPPGGTVDMDRILTPEALVVLGGALDVKVPSGADTGWRTLNIGEALRLAEPGPVLLNNKGSQPVQLGFVASRPAASFR